MVEVIEVEDCGENIGDYDIPIHNAIIIPKGATNGDVIKAMFPNIKYYATCVEVKLEYHGQYDTGLLFDKKWWNTPYKKERED